VAGGGGREGELPWQLRACRAIVGVTTAQRPNSGVFEIEGGWQACCGVVLAGLRQGVSGGER